MNFTKNGDFINAINNSLQYYQLFSPIYINKNTLELEDIKTEDNLYLGIIGDKLHESSFAEHLNYFTFNNYSLEALRDFSTFNDIEELYDSLEISEDVNIFDFLDNIEEYEHKIDPELFPDINDEVDSIRCSLINDEIDEAVHDFGYYGLDTTPLDLLKENNEDKNVDPGTVLDKLNFYKYQTEGLDFSYFSDYNRDQGYSSWNDEEGQGIIEDILSHNDPELVNMEFLNSLPNYTEEDPIDHELINLRRKEQEIKELAKNLYMNLEVKAGTNDKKRTKV